MKHKWSSIFQFLGFAKSQAEAKAEKATLEETDVDAISAALTERDSFKTQLDASLNSEKQLQNDLKAANDKVADLQAKLTASEEAKTKAEGDLATAKEVISGKIQNPWAKTDDPNPSTKESVSITAPEQKSEYVTNY